MASPALAKPKLAFEDLTGPERSAALIMFLHPRVAASLLAQLSAGEVAQVGIAMKRLDRLSPQLLDQVVDHACAAELRHRPSTYDWFVLANT